jgi:hypothetical protein
MALASSKALALSESSHFPGLLFSTEHSLVWWATSCWACLAGGPRVRPGMAAKMGFLVCCGDVLGIMSVMEMLKIAVSLDGILMFRLVRSVLKLSEQEHK